MYSRILSLIVWTSLVVSHLLRIVVVDDEHGWKLRFANHFPE